MLQWYNDTLPKFVFTDIVDSAPDWIWLLKVWTEDSHGLDYPSRQFAPSLLKKASQGNQSHENGSFKKNNCYCEFYCAFESFSRLQLTDIQLL